MGAWVDITAAANWQPRYRAVDSSSCASTWATPSASANVFAFSGGHWVGPDLDITAGVPSPAALPSLEYVGSTDVSSVTALRVTALVQDDFTISAGGSEVFLLVACDPTDPTSLYAYHGEPVLPVVRSDYLADGLYSAATEMVVEDACTEASLAAVTAVMMGHDSDNCGVYMDYTTRALTITKIEVFIDTVPEFWTDFVNCAEI